MADKPIVRALNDIPFREVARATGASMQVLLGADEGMTQFYTRCFTLEAGGAIPAHRHDTIQHQQLVLEGSMLLRLGEEVRQVRAGEAIYIPPGMAHSYRNPGPGPVRFLCVVPATTEYQTEWLEE